MRTIQVAAPPGPLCEQIERLIKQLQENYEFDCSVELINDFEDIIGMQVYSVPGLLIDGILMSVGRIPELSELVDWLDLDRVEP